MTRHEEKVAALAAGYRTGRLPTMTPPTNDDPLYCHAKLLEIADIDVRIETIGRSPEAQALRTVVVRARAAQRELNQNHQRKAWKEKK